LKKIKKKPRKREVARIRLLVGLRWRHPEGVIRERGGRDLAEKTASRGEKSRFAKGTGLRPFSVPGAKGVAGKKGAYQGKRGTATERGEREKL